MSQNLQTQSSAAAAQIATMARSEEFRNYLRDLLVSICAIDTTPRGDLPLVAKSEDQVFAILDEHVRGYGLAGLSIERKPINPAIEQHRYYSKPYYTRSSATPQGLSAADAYRGRYNLVCITPGGGQNAGGAGQAINAHIDVVHPYIPPRVEGDVVFGRGSCDDKGPVVSMLGAMKLLGQFLKEKGLTLNRDLVTMIVIEEEMGGNGSLSMALDRELRGHYDCIVVGECTGSKIHPGNRGAVWYKIEAHIPGENLFEASAFAVEAMEKEGRAIRSESRHDLFPHRPVQTCHGIFGKFGGHPSGINGRIDFEIVFASMPAPAAAAALKLLVQDVVEDGLNQYIGLYGDKTKINDPLTGKPKVDHHYDFLDAPHGFTVQVHGSTGHMGSILENDGAITKMASMIRSLVTSRATIEQTAGSKVHCRLCNWDDPSQLIMEGGQGFLPTHPMDQVQERMRNAVWRGAEAYFRIVGRNVPVREKFITSYDKLHNAAFSGKADSPDMLNAIAAAEAAGIWPGGPVRGWDVSCDSRLFASEYSDLTVLTGGPGLLSHAHANNEQCNVRDIASFAEFLANFILRQTATVPA